MSWLFMYAVCSIVRLFVSLMSSANSALLQSLPENASAVLAIRLQASNAFVHVLVKGACWRQLRDGLH